MKLSEMPTRKAAEAMAALAAPIGKLAKSPAVKKWIASNGQTDMTLESMTEILAEVLPVFLKDNYDDTVKVVSVLSGKTVAVINEQPIKTTIEDIKASMDGDLLSFFH
jgi:hypothetical protein